MTPIGLAFFAVVALAAVAAASAVIIVRNAKRHLPACLESLVFCDEVVVVDSGSTDGTAELAAAAGARVVQKEWLGYGPQKQFAVEQAKHDWVLCVDADERVRTEAVTLLEKRKAAH